jgi:two-component system, LytTR family, sensor histidine kinase AgrC
MMDYLALLPVIALIIFNIIRILKYGIRKYWWAALLFLTGTAAVWYLVHTFLSSWDTKVIMTLCLVVISVEIFQQLNYRMSLSFYLLFLLTIALAAGSSFAFPKVDVVNEYLMLFIYFLAESNQRHMKKNYEERAAQYQNMVLSKQVSEVQNIYMTMRGWRHDYHNHLQTLKAHLKMNLIEEAKEYLDKLELDLDSIHNLIESGNVNLDAILNSKLSLALKENIDIKFKAEVPTLLTVSDIDLCVLIGNLIDNAVEACEQITELEEQRFIRLYIGVLKKQLYVSITNSTKEAIRKLDEEYITTKRGNHGHGLKRINKIVEKYEGYINRKNEPGVFVTEILLPL